MKESLFHFYIIFHQILFEKNTKSFTEEERNRMLRWVSVNEAIPKSFPPWIPKDLQITESELLDYSPLYQMSHFYQNSFFFILPKNKHLLKTPYVGFGQYDMSISADSFRTMEHLLEGEGKVKQTLFVVYPYAFEALYDLFDKCFWEEILEKYNTLYCTSHSFEHLSQLSLPLLHTFVLPTQIFLECMEFVETSLPFLLKRLNWNTRHLAGTLERVLAIAINIKVLERKLVRVLHLKGIDHIGSQHTEDLLRNISVGASV